MHFQDKVLDHLLGHVDVGNDAVTKRADRLDAVGRLAHHHLGVVAHGLDALDTVDCLDGDHRRLVEHNPPATNINNGICGAKVDRHIMAHELEKT